MLMKSFVSCIVLKRICLILCLYCSLPVSAEALLKHIQSVSRDYYYVSPSQGLYKHHSAVGGEHETHYYILGFAGDSLLLDITSADQYVGHIITREGINIRSKQWNSEIGKMTYIIDVNVQHVWIDVSFSAHPYADYFLQVSK